MATITAQSILNRAATILQDTTNTRWPEDELLDWLNDGQREIVLYKPDAAAKVESVQLVEGTQQTIPADGLSLLDVIRNVAADGSLGNAIRLTERRQLDDQIPGWHAQSKVGEVQHYIFDERSPKSFWVYPPSDGTGKVDVMYSASPGNVGKTEAIAVDDVYSNALLDYVLYRAYMKDADYAANDQRATAQYQRFMQALGILDNTETKNNPYVRKTSPVVGGQ
jgi:hypothetical protein